MYTKFFLPTASALLMIYGEVGKEVKLLRGGGGWGKKAGSGNILWWNMTWASVGGNKCCQRGKEETELQI